MELFSVWRNAARNGIEISIVTEDDLPPCVTAAFCRTGVDQLKEQQTSEPHFLSEQSLFRSTHFLAHSSGKLSQPLSGNFVD